MKGSAYYLILFSLFIFIANPVIGQEAEIDSSANNIDRYIEATVDIETTLTVEAKGMFLESGDRIECDVKIGSHIIPATIYGAGDTNKIKFGGSGAFIDKDGHILTAAHVVKSDNDEVDIGTLFSASRAKVLEYEYWVVLKHKNRQYKAVYVGGCVGADYAMLRGKDINPADYRVIPIGKSSELKVGDPVTAIGTPYGFSGSTTRGIVSQLNRRIGMNYYEDFIQTDAAINPGNSGGPLLNARGELVGVNTAAIPGSSMGFAVAIDMIHIEEIKKGEIEIPWFGAEAAIAQFARRGRYGQPGINDLITLYNQTGIEDAKSLIALADLTYFFTDNDANKPIDYQNKWAVVVQVEAIGKDKDQASPANKAGLQKGDLIIRANNVRIKDGMDLRLALQHVPKDKDGKYQPIEIRYIRVTDGVAKEESCNVTMETKK